MNFKFNVKVGGLFKLEVLDKDGNKKREIDWFENLVLDAGLEAMPDKDWFDGVHVGSGNSAPSPEQIALDAIVATNSTMTSNGQGVGVSEDGLFSYLSRTKIFRFNAGSFNGSTLREIGIAMRTTGGAAPPIWNRALIKNSQGNPTSITLGSDEILDVTVEVRVYQELADKTGSFDILDRDNAVVNTINYVARPAKNQTAWSVIGYALRSTSWNSAYLYTGSIRTPDSTPSGSNLVHAASGNAATITHFAYEAGSCVQKHRVNIPITTGNGTIKSMMIQTILGCWQLEFDPPFTKTVDETLHIYYQYSWGRR